MASYSRHFTRHLVVTVAVMTLASAGAAVCFCGVPASLNHSWRMTIGAAFVVLWAIMAARLWRIVRTPLRQMAFYVGAMESRDTTMYLPHSDDPLLGPVMDDMNRVLRNYCADRFAIESQRQYYDRILRVMTHELRNSITPIISLSDWMCQHKMSDEDFRDSIHIIHEQAESIRDFLGTYHELTHLPEPQLTHTPVRTLFDNLRLTLSGEPLADRIHYVISGEPVVHADAKLIHLALLNIVRNAMQAIDGQADGRVSLNASASSEGIRIVVSNNGPLIPPTDIEQIFLPFYSTKKEGSGIGLALSRRIMELHGGTLTCDSNPPLTLFTFVFPGNGRSSESQQTRLPGRVAKDEDEANSYTGQSMVAEP